MKLNLLGGGEMIHHYYYHIGESIAVDRMIKFAVTSKLAGTISHVERAFFLSLSK